MRQYTIPRYFYSEISKYRLDNSLIRPGFAIVLTISVRSDDSLYSTNVMKNEPTGAAWRDADRSSDSVSSTKGSFEY